MIFMDQFIDILGKRVTFQKANDFNFKTIMLHHLVDNNDG